MGAGCSTIDGQLGEHDRCRPRLPRSVKQRRERRQKKKYTKPRKERKRRHVLQALNAEAQTGELLSRIPGRICINGSTSSACAFTQQGKKGVNQDALLVWEQFASRRDTLLCAVFDGHGPYGHLVSRRVRDMLPSKLVTAWKAHMRGELDNMDNGYASKDSEDESLEEDEEGYDTEEYAGNWPEHIGQTKQANPGLGKRIEDEQRRRQGHLVMRAWKECLMKTFRSMDRDLRVQPTIDCFCSGTTAILLVQQGSELIIGNVGDSRAVLATFDEGTTALDCGTSKISEVGHLRAIQLSVDLKPNLPKEQARIRRCKGRVFAASDEPDVPRVWLPYDSAPGLAMARAFGDFCLKDYGLISVPDITYWTLSPDDQFVILATDGIWDVMSNTEAVEVVASAPSRVTAARLLVEGAAKLWKQKYPTSRADDCAAVCLFFHRNPGTTVRHCMPRILTFSDTDEDEEYGVGDEEDEDDDIIMNGHGRALISRSSSSSPELGECSNGDAMESSLAAYMRHHNVGEADESEEVMDNQFHLHARNTLSNMPYPGYFVDSPENLSPPSVLETQEVEWPSSSNIHRMGKEPATISSPCRNLAEYIISTDKNDVHEEWSALEGEVRVNSILNLPRFKANVPQISKKA